jgi:hypothetical protein
MEVGEKVYEEDGKLIIKKSHDFSQVLKQMEEIRRNGIIGMDGDKTGKGDARFIGRVPMALVDAWCKEAGIKSHDTEARAEVIKRKILSGDFDAFRSDWKGNY